MIISSKFRGRKVKRTALLHHHHYFWWSNEWVFTFISYELRLHRYCFKARAAYWISSFVYQRPWISIYDHIAVIKRNFSATFRTLKQSMFRIRSYLPTPYEQARSGPVRVPSQATLCFQMLTSSDKPKSESAGWRWSTAMSPKVIVCRYTWHVHVPPISTVEWLGYSLHWTDKGVRRFKC